MKKKDVSDLHQNNSSELRFKLLSEAAFESIIIHDGNRIIDANEQACRLFKYQRRTLIGLPVKKIFLPAYHTMLEEKIRNDVSSAYVAENVKQDGEFFFSEIRGKSLYTDTGKIRIVAIRDNTQQIQYEQRLAFQYRLALLFQSGKEGRIVFRQFLRMLCRTYHFEIGELYRADQKKRIMVLTETWYEKSHSELSVFAEKSRGTVFPYGAGFPGIAAETGKPVCSTTYPDPRFLRNELLINTRIHTIDCIPFFLNGSIGGCYMLFSEKTGISSVDYLYSTVSAQFAQYLEAQESRSQLELANGAVHALPLVVYVTDRKGHILWSNQQKASEIFCAGEKSLSVSDLPDPIYKIERKGIQTIDHGQKLYREKQKCNAAPGVTGRVYEIVITPLKKNTAGRISFFTLTVTDITEQEKMQEALNQYSLYLEEQVHTRSQELSTAYSEIFRQQKIEQELVLAGDIQKSLLPQRPPLIRGWDIAARAVPASSTGGDLYDFIRYSDNIFYIFMADISGKGISAALMTSAARAITREKIKSGREPGSIVSMVNESMHEDLSRIEMFITLFILRIDLAHRILSYANAGHTRTVVISPPQKGPVFMEATCIPVGILPDIEDVTKTLSYVPDLNIVIYSDGMTEAFNPAQELYGEGRFTALVQKNCRHTAEHQLSAVFRAIANYRKQERQSDDCTLVIMKCLFQETGIVLQAYPAEADRLVTFIKMELNYLGSEFVSDMSLVVMELFTNILEHSIGVNMETGECMGNRYPVSLNIHSTSDRITLDFRNEGAFFDSAGYHNPELGGEQIGGYGLFLIRQLTDTVTYTHTDHENMWHLEKEIRRADYA